MNYSDVLKRSFDITRHYRVLWVFGFLIALFSGGGGGGGGFQSSFQRRISEGDLGIPPEVGLVLIISAVVLILVLILISAIVQYVSQTALIALVGEIQAGQQPTVRHGFELGWSRNALRLFAVDLTLFGPLVLGLLALLVLILIPFLVLAPAAGNGGTIGPLIFLFICCLFFLILLLIPIIIGVGILREFAQRQVVLAGDGVFDSIRHAYQLVRANVVHILVMWLILLVVGLVWGVINLIIGLVAIGLVFGPAAFVYALTNSLLIAILTGLPFLVIVMIFFAAINALYKVFTSTVWTLTYFELPNRTVTA